MAKHLCSCDVQVIVNSPPPRNCSVHRHKWVNAIKIAHADDIQNGNNQVVSEYLLWKGLFE